MWSSYDAAVMTFRSLFVLVTCSILLVAPAAAFELTRTVTGQHVRWQVGPNEPLQFTIDNGLGDDLNLGEDFTRTVIVKAMKTWEHVNCSLCHCPRGVACPPIACQSHPLGVRFTDDPQWAEQSLALGPSCVNLAGETTAIDSTTGDCPFAGGPWKKQPNGNQVAFLTGDEWVFSKFTIALTLVAANQVSGAIGDADILVNARDKVFCVEDCKSNEFDLQGTISHEVGHVLGLDHSGVNGATMVLQGQPGDLSMRTLEADDVAGVCLAYRMAFDPNGCPPAGDATGCSAQASSQGDYSAALLLVLGLLLLLAGRFARVGAARLYSARKDD